MEKLLYTKGVLGTEMLSWLTNEGGAALIEQAASEESQRGFNKDGDPWTSVTQILSAECAVADSIFEIRFEDATPPRWQPAIGREVSVHWSTSGASPGVTSLLERFERRFVRITLRRKLRRESRAPAALPIGVDDLARITGIPGWSATSAPDALPYGDLVLAATAADHVTFEVWVKPRFIQQVLLIPVGLADAFYGPGLWEYPAFPYDYPANQAGDPMAWKNPRLEKLIEWTARTYGPLVPEDIA